MSSTGQGDHSKSIGKTGSKVVVDVPGFAEAGKEHDGWATTTPIDHFNLNMFSGLTREGDESDMIGGRIDPVGPLTVGTTPGSEQRCALLAQGTGRPCPVAGCLRTRCIDRCSTTAAGCQAGTGKQRSDQDLREMPSPH